jgi:cytochrome P450
MTSTVRYGHAPGSLPLLGHAYRFLNDPLPFLASLPARGDLVRIRLGTSLAVVVCEPTLARQVLRDDRVFDKDGPVIRRMREVLGNGLVACPHSDHRRQRRLVQPAFRRDRMPGYARTMLNQIDGIVGGWPDGGEVDVPADMKRLSTSVTVASMFANRLSPTQIAQMIEDFATVSAMGLARTMVPAALLRLPLPANRRNDRAGARVRRTFLDVIAEARADGTDYGDLLSMLIVGDEENGEALTDEEIADQISTFFVAGVDTTANLVTSSVHLTVHNPDIQRRLQAEVDAAVAAGPLDHARLADLEQTGRVVTEALRLYPPGWMIARFVTVDTELGGHPIPAGTCVIVSPYQVHRQPEVYPRPEEFEPERWLGAPKALREGFIPYGVGARKCIGDDFAHTEAVLALASIIARWRLEPVTGAHYDPSCHFTLRPRSLRVRVVDRTADARRPDPTVRDAGVCVAGG